MPFGGWFDQYWEHIYQPAIKAANLTPRRADDVFRAGSVMSEVWRQTQAADLLIADLATRNSNVFYELGLAHAIAKPVILISDNIEDVPFDLRGLRVLLYDRNDPLWGVQLRSELTTALRETLQEPGAAVPPTFAGGGQDTSVLKREPAVSPPVVETSLEVPTNFAAMHSRFPVVPPKIDFEQALRSILDDLAKKNNQ